MDDTKQDPYQKTQNFGVTRSKLPLLAGAFTSLCPTAIRFGMFEKKPNIYAESIMGYPT